MRAVNLMPPDERRTRFDTRRLPFLAAAGAVVVVTAAAFLLASSASNSADHTEAELQAVEAAIARLPKAPDSAVSVGSLVQERSSRVAALAAALRSRTAFDRLLREVSFVLPEDAWLTQFEAIAPAPVSTVDGATLPPQATARSGVTIRGATYSHDSVAIVLARLAVLPSLSDVQLTSAALVEPRPEEDGGTAKSRRPFVTFAVTAVVRTGDSS